ncbi:9514_t:CDS:2, partial [Acaulospora colombiana]
FAITAVEENMQAKVLFRTYRHSNNIASNATVIEAMMATCALVPYFEPISIGTGFQRKSHIAGPLSCINPVREVMSEAYNSSPNPSSEYVAALVSLGAGHPELWQGEKLLDPEFIISQAVSCCAYPEIEEQIKNCANSLKSGLGIATLEQLTISPNFVMRDEPWGRLMEALTERVYPPIQKVVVVSGMAGYGKTQLCANFEHVLSIDGSSVASIQADLVAHVRSIGPEYSQASLAEALRFLCDRRNQNWFLFIDNADNENWDLSSYIPDCNHGFILVTTRNRHLGSFASKPEWHIELDVMSNEEALSVLKHGKISTSNEDEQFLPKVAAELGYLPVALSQARAYMQENRCSAREYLDLFKTSRGNLLNYNSQERQRANAFTSFSMSFNRLPGKAKKFLYILSHYHFIDFPLQAFALAAQSQFKLEPHALLSRNGPSLESIIHLRYIFFTEERWTSSSQHEIMRALQNYSMISFSSGFKTDLFRMHPLFRDWLFDNIPADHRALSLAAATRVLVCNWGTRWMQPYLVPHIMHIVSLKFMENMHVNDAAALGRVLREGDQLKVSKKVWKEVYKRIEKVQGSSGMGVADAALELAHTYLDDPVRMKELRSQALAIYQDTLGTNHEKTYSARDSLASTYEQMTKFSEAEKIKREVLKWRTEKNGEMHVATLDSMQSLANNYQLQGKYEDAKTLWMKVLNSRSALLGAQHIDTVRAIYGLGCTYHSQEEYHQAESCILNALSIRKRTMGEDHNDTLQAMEELALICCSLQKYDQARQLQEKILSVRRCRLGDDHADTLRAMSHLVSTYRSLGEKTELEKLELDICEITARQLAKKNRVKLPEADPQMSNTAEQTTAPSTISNDAIKEEESTINPTLIDIPASGVPTEPTQTVSDQVTESVKPGNQTQELASEQNKSTRQRDEPRQLRPLKLVEARRQRAQFTSPPVPHQEPIKSVKSRTRDAAVSEQNPRVRPVASKTAVSTIETATTSARVKRAAPSQPQTNNENSNGLWSGTQRIAAPALHASAIQAGSQRAANATKTSASGERVVETASCVPQRQIVSSSMQHPTIAHFLAGAFALGLFSWLGIV